MERYREYKYLYRQMLDEQVIRKAYKNLRKGKTKRKEIQDIDARLDEEVAKMKAMIENTRPVEVEHPELAYKPKKRTPRFIKEHGKVRKLYMPEIHEQWLHHIIVLILAPIVMATAHPLSCGSVPGKGAHYGKKHVEKWIRSGNGIRNFAKIDIRHFYDNIRIEVLMRELAVRIKDEWFLYIIRLCLDGFRKGIPLGFYISQWLANYLLEPLDRFITETLGIKKDARYMDDIVMFDNAKKNLHRAVAEIRKFVGRRFRLKLKRTYQICRFHYIRKDGRQTGRALDYMGFLFFRNRTTIRKSTMLNATKMARKLHKAKQEGRRYYIKTVRAVVSQMGWFKCTQTYDCYSFNIKPNANIRTLRKIISKTERRSSNENLDRRALPGAA